MNKALKLLLPNFFIAFLKKIVAWFNYLNHIRDLLISHQSYQIKTSHPNPLNHFGSKSISQTDEDGITIEILRRIKCLEIGTFAEFGVGDGTENNTLILKAMGWKGFWVGGENLAFNINTNKKDFLYLKDWISLDNILTLAHTGKNYIDSGDIDLISLDLDGNDIYLVEELLKNDFLPKLFIVEYNAKFIPPIKWKINYDKIHTWQGDDYFGASLSSFVELFKLYNYTLICCNSHSGANAFFIRNDLMNLFADVPNDIYKIYVQPRYFTYHLFGQKPSIKTIEKLFN